MGKRHHHNNTEGTRPEKPQLTHFISIPIRSPEIKNSFLEFKQKVQDENVSKISHDAFYSVNKLHLTLAVLSLLTSDQIKEGIDLLNEFKTAIIDKVIKNYTKLSASLKICGVDVMGSNEKKSRVVYAKIESAFVQGIANELVEMCKVKGLCTDGRPVLMHMTVINLRNARRNRMRNFDASWIVENFKDFNFGVEVLDEFQLSKMSEVGEDGYYASEGFITIKDDFSDEQSGILTT